MSNLQCVLTALLSLYPYTDRYCGVRATLGGVFQSAVCSLLPEYNEYEYSVTMLASGGEWID